MGFESMDKFFKKVLGPSPETFEKAEDDVNAFLKRDFDALKPEEQKAMLDAEAEKLRGEIDTWRNSKEEKDRAYADELESKFDGIIRARAEVRLNKRLRGVERN